MGRSKDSFQDQANSRIQRNVTTKHMASRAGVSPSAVARVMGGYGYANDARKKALIIAKNFITKMEVNHIPDV